MSNMGRLQHDQQRLEYTLMSNREDVAAAQHILVSTTISMTNRRCTGDQSNAGRAKITEGQRQKQEQSGTAT